MRQIDGNDVLIANDGILVNFLTVPKLKFSSVCVKCERRLFKVKVALLRCEFLLEAFRGNFPPLSRNPESRNERVSSSTCDRMVSNSWSSY